MPVPDRPRPTILPDAGRRTTRTRKATLLLPAGAALALLAACTQSGDFGRPRTGVWNGLIDTTGSFSVRDRGRLILDSGLTDDEQALRDRAWRFVQPASTFSAFQDALLGLASAHATPTWRFDEVGAYYDTLIAEPSRSPVSRYRQLADDATADARLIPIFTALAARVIDADAARLRSLPFAKTLDDADIRLAAQHVAENRCLIAWVRIETGLRLARYRYALEHLFAQAPAPESVSAERSLAMLAARRNLLVPLLPPDAAARCGLEAAIVPVAEAPPLVAKN
ncbi:hypothetical protein [Methylobacterium pseudosasicola]|uniref:Uncharacterized protein n=1 Tax=Methylobacterium pseudosasicola TaxID=582667 RepID=A0A1I4ID83_9HYPH|nr:hypothetical protein [Methylobacterium pseudosasicola]SFL52319.1 hypothetical protein SAMN05192568_100676 [Methylobacterium pseudosasicola]